MNKEEVSFTLLPSLSSPPHAHFRLQISDLELVFAIEHKNPVTSTNVIEDLIPNGTSIFSVQLGGLMNPSILMSMSILIFIQAEM